MGNKLFLLLLVFLTSCNERGDALEESDTSSGSSSGSGSSSSSNGSPRVLSQILPDQPLQSSAETADLFSQDVTIIEYQDLSNQGVWTPTSSYNQLDMVTFGGSSYVATSNTTSGEIPANPWDEVKAFVLGTSYEAENIYVTYNGDLYKTGWYSSGPLPDTTWQGCKDRSSAWWSLGNDLSCEWKKVDEIGATIPIWDGSLVGNVGDIVSHSGEFYTKKLDYSQAIDPGTQVSNKWFPAPGVDTVFYNGIEVDQELFERIKIATPLKTGAAPTIDFSNPNNNPANVKRVMTLVSESDFNYMFPVRHSVYTYRGLIEAISRFPSFCGDRQAGDSDEICKRELATVFAHNNQETGAHSETGDDITDLSGNIILEDTDEDDFNGRAIAEWRQAFYHVNEFCGDRTGNSCASYRGSECTTDQWQGRKYPCPAGKMYYGRGAKQLSYNYNYGYYSQIMYGTPTVLLDNPEKVAEEPALAISSAIWFYMTPQLPKPSMHEVNTGMWQPTAADVSAGRTAGFGVTTMIINGGVECGGNVEVAQSKNRIQYFEAFADRLGLSIPSGEKLGCANMVAFDSQGESPYITPDLDGCESLATYVTAYSIFVPDDIDACFEQRYE